MKFFILLSLFLSFSCRAGVWYYGSGEAVNLENVMGFQNEPAKIEVDGYYVYRRDLNGALVQFGSNNPELGELMKYPSFEESDAEVTVTNATKALVANNFHGTQALQCTGTGANARCCVEIAVPAQRAGIRHEVSCNLKTADTGVEFTLRNNSTDRGFYEVASTDEWTAYSFLVDANTNVGFCIDQADTDVTLADNCSITSNLSKRAAVDCANDLDCTNTFDFVYNGTTFVDQFGNSYGVTKSETGNFRKTIDVISIATQKMGCSTAGGTSGNNAQYRLDLGTASQLVFDTFKSDTGVNEDTVFTATCTKRGSDYKTIPERGVINVNMDAQFPTEVIDLTGSGGFTGGSIVVTKVGKIVTITELDLLTHASLTSVESATGLLPIWARPQASFVSNVYGNSGANFLAMRAFADGKIATLYSSERTNSGLGVIASYSVESAARQEIVADLSNGINKTCVLTDQKSNEESGGATSSTTWNPRILNTAMGDCDFVSLSNGTTGTDGTANYFTLGRGNYLIECTAPSYGTNLNQLRLRQDLITTPSNALLGSGAYARSGSDASSTYAEVVGTLSVESSTVYQLQHYATAANINGLGLAVSSGVAQYFARCSVTRR